MAHSFFLVTHALLGLADTLVSSPVAGLAGSAAIPDNLTGGTPKFGVWSTAFGADGERPMGAAVMAVLSAHLHVYITSVAGFFGHSVDASVGLMHIAQSLFKFRLDLLFPFIELLRVDGGFGAHACARAC